MHFRRGGEGLSLDRLQQELHATQVRAAEPDQEQALPAEPVPIRGIFAPVIAGAESIFSLIHTVQEKLTLAPLPSTQVALGRIISFREVKLAQDNTPLAQHQQMDTDIMAAVALEENDDTHVSGLRFGAKPFVTSNPFDPEDTAPYLGFHLRTSTGAPSRHFSARIAGRRVVSGMLAKYNPDNDKAIRIGRRESGLNDPEIAITLGRVASPTVLSALAQEGFHIQSFVIPAHSEALITLGAPVAYNAEGLPA